MCPPACNLQDRPDVELAIEGIGIIKIKIDVKEM